LQLSIRRVLPCRATPESSVSRRAERAFQCAAAFSAIAIGFLWHGGLSDKATLDSPARPVEEFRFVPVRVHLLRSPESPAVGTTLMKSDIERIFRKANGIWHAAGVHLFPESVVEEKPAQLDDPHASIVGTSEELRPLRPASSRSEGMFHVYYVGKMEVNGIFLGRDAVFVQQAAQLRMVEGGIDEPLPRVTSHELGHGLGLAHRQNRTNLMASGTTGTSLNDAEITTARETCGKLDWVLAPGALVDSAEKLQKEGKADAAEVRFRAVADLPGESPVKERAQKGLSKAPHPM
jgi:hypothetical protein